MNLSTRTQNLVASPIREILAVIDRPGMISFAGGLPAAETFPKMDLSAMPKATLQYGPSEGEMTLRERVRDELTKLGFQIPAAQILITSGSQQGIDLVGKLFIDAGTRVAVETPTYLAALQVFRYYGAQFQSFTAQNCATSIGDDAAFAYVIPTFQNPTGHCYTSEERAALSHACDARNIPLFEDDPYRDLVFDDCDRTPICTQFKIAPWIYQGSFSKSLAPGVRLGFLACSPEFVTPLTRLKQAADLHSNRVSQWWVLQQLNDVNRDARLTTLAHTYRAKRDHFASELSEHFGDLATWCVPQGGLFFWLQLNRPLDTNALLQKAIAANVAFMPGAPFYANEKPSNATLRLNFSHASHAGVTEGLATLAALIRNPQIIESAPCK
jgi:2-aminoadipate transaminase